MSFGLSFGDLVSVLTLANKLRRDFVGAPSQFNSISREVRGLAIILQDVDVQLPNLNIDARQLKQLGEISHSCGTLLGELQDAIGKYKVVEYCGTSIHKKARSIWKRISWEPKDIGELRDRLLSNVTLLQSFLNAISSQTMAAAKQTLEQINQRQESQEETYILDWLTTVDYTAQQSDFLGRRQAQTGEWLLASEQYKNWLQTRRATLFCPGMPGAGKTICSAIVVDDLTMRFENNPDVGIAYIYCNFNRNEEQRAPDLLLSLLKQLSRNRTPVPDPVKDLYKRYKTTSMRPQFGEISRALNSIISMYSGVFIVIDALDECQPTCRSRFLAEIAKVRTEAGVSVFATSRPTEMDDLFKGGALLEICAHDIDVRRYLDGNMFRLPGFVSRNIALQEEIMTLITRNTQGMFLLAQLHFESLIGRRSAKSTRTALKEFSKGFSEYAYDDAYSNTMSRIRGQMGEQTDLAMQTLSWLTFARRPLTALELQHALAIEKGLSDLDEENIPQIEDILAVCAGLATHDNESGIIRLVHYTTQEYLERKMQSFFPIAEHEISTLSVTYLLFDAFTTGICKSDELYEERLQSHPFYSYAVRYWGDHVRLSGELHPDVIRFLEEGTTNLEASVQALKAMWHPNWKDWSQRFSNTMTGFHLAAHFGIEEAVSYFLQRGYPADLCHNGGWTALQLAIQLGHLNIAHLLLASGADPNKKYQDNSTPLSTAAENGYEAIIRLLLDRGVEVNAPCGWHGSALIAACDKGQIKSVEILLNNNANINAENEMYGSALTAAAMAGHWGLVTLLLDKGAKPDHQENDVPTALQTAASQGQEDVVRILLDRHADIDRQGANGSALTVASMNGRQQVVQMLLDGGANINAETDSGTALIAAAAKGKSDIVKLLLDSGADVHGRGRLHGTALHAAASFGSAQVVQMLLDRGADTTTRGGIFKTAFRAAIMRGHPEVASLLQSQGHQIRV